MISLRYYLDTRKPSSRPDGKFPLKLAVTKRGDTALLPVLAYATREEWDPKAQRLKGGRLGDAGRVNTYLARQMLRFEQILRDLVDEGDAATMTARQVRDVIAQRVMEAGPGISLGEYYDKVTKEKHGSTRLGFENARASYERAVPRIMERPLSSVTDKDVQKIDDWLRRHLAPNTRNTYIAKLTQVLKRAHREGLVAADAGRDVKLMHVIPKSRALTVEQLRILLAADPGTDAGREALDFFRLSFYLRAINPEDLFRVGPDDIFNGRLQYTRAKTGRDLSVRVEPEAAEIIARRGDASHLFSPGKWTDKRNRLQKMDAALRLLAKGNGLPPVTMYWARHTFSSLIIELGYSMELLAGALGHSLGPRITAGYVTLQQRKVDDVARRVYDYVAGSWEPER